MKKSKRFLAVVLIAAFACMMIPTIGLLGRAQDEEQQSYTPYSDSFINSDGTFNTSAVGFPADYVFDLIGLKTDWTSATNNFFARVPKKFFMAVKTGGQTATLVDGLGNKHIFRPEDISDNLDTFTDDATFNVGTLYRKSAGYGTTGQTIAQSSGLGITPESFIPWDNFAFLQAVSAPGAAIAAEIQVILDVKNIFPNVTDSSAGGSAEYFYNIAKENKLYVYEYAKSAVTARPTELALALDNNVISFKRSTAKNTDDCGNKQYMFSDRPLKAADIYTKAAWQDSFVTEGKFNENAEGFPKNYEFDFSAKITGTAWSAPISKGFFNAVKESGRTVTVIDKIGVKYMFDAKNISDISTDSFADTVLVGGRYRSSASYVTVAKTIASNNMGIDANTYNIKENFGFVEVHTGEGIATNCKIRLAMDFAENNTVAAKHFYDLAVANNLYVYQYSSSKLTTRATEMAKAVAEPEIIVNKLEAGSMQLFFSDRQLRNDTPSESESSESQSSSSQSSSSQPEQPTSANYKAEFVKNGQFVTTAAGFPTSYTFKFGAYTSSNMGFSKDLFQAIKNSGRVVTLIDRFNVSYVFDGSKMTDIPAATRNELFQLQSLYKSSGSFQTVMAKVAGKAKIFDGFYMNEDWIILDVQPWTELGQSFAVDNSFPVDALIKVNLNNNVSGTAGAEIAAKFAQYARDGKLKAYFYDKTSSVQDLFEDKEPITPTVNEKGEVCFTISQPATLVACVGDSITKGALASNLDTKSYPAQLQNILGIDYTVKNFGVGGSTLLKNGDKPYWEQSLFSQSTGFNPDIVIIMLGTNDAKPRNWVYKDKFVSDLSLLVNHYRSLKSKPVVYIATSPTAYTNGIGVTDNTISGEVVKLQRQVARNMKCAIIDINSVTKNKPTLFADGVHPNDSGYAVIANAMSTVVKTYVNADLSGIKVDNMVLTEFDASKTSYSLVLPKGTTKLPVVTAYTTIPGATLTIKQTDKVNGMAKITVTAEDKKTIKTYSILFSVGNGQSSGQLSKNEQLSENDKLPENEDVVVLNVIEMINKIPPTIYQEDENNIKAAREAYDNLTTLQQAKVTNYSNLTEAENTILQLRNKDTNKDNTSAQAPQKGNSYNIVIFIFGILLCFALIFVLIFRKLYLRTKM